MKAPTNPAFVSIFEEVHGTHEQIHDDVYINLDKTEPGNLCHMKNREWYLEEEWETLVRQPGLGS